MLLNGPVLNEVVLNGAPAADLGEELMLQASLALSQETAWNQPMSLLATAALPTELFYNPTPEIVLEGSAQLNTLVSYVEAVLLVGAGALATEQISAAHQWLLARADDTLQTDLTRIAEELLAARTTDQSVAAFAELLTDSVQIAASYETVIALRILDALAASLTAEATMLVSVTETLGAEAGDSVQALGHYLQNINDLAGAWMVFKASGEVVQGWVMNVEGDRPFSEYRGFEFNSMTKIGDAYFGASDDGLYALTGDTDANEPINAKLGSMMLDFDTSAQKRVVAAYLGYTSTGTVMLKVRSVDQGKLVEHWYKATEVTADAPRESYRPLGRGLKSRYWQFEIENVDGADFEIDKLELQPIKLRRRT